MSNAELFKKVFGIYAEEFWAYSEEKMLDWLTSDVTDRKAGKWIHGKELGREMIGDCITAIFYEGWKCSECGCTVEEERQPTWRFCPNCGAEMEASE